MKKVVQAEGAKCNRSIGSKSERKKGKQRGLQSGRPRRREQN
jgi:hypothetical protein